MSKPPSVHSIHDGEATESSPLLVQEDNGHTPSSPAISQHPSQRRRWPSLAALAALCAGVIAVLAVGFFAPAIAEQYAAEAIVLNISSISDTTFLDTGVRTRVQGSVDIDAELVHNSAVRILGRAATRIARKVNTGAFTVDVYVPEHGGKLLGSAEGPATVIDIRNGHSTPLDFFVEARPGELEAIRDLADEYVRGKLDKLRISGVVKMRPKSGIISLGVLETSRELLLEGVPSLPQYKITKLNFGEVERSHGAVMSANVSAVVSNPYPLDFSIPSLGFEVSITGCEMDSHVSVAIATSYPIHIEPRTDIKVDIEGLVHKLPIDLITVCPKSNMSPMDTFIAGYLQGHDSLVYVTGNELDHSDTPTWLLEFLKSITLPVPFPGHTFENIIDSFSLSHVYIKLPSDDDDNLSPLLSADIEVIIRLPEEMDVSLDVRRLKSDARISYEDKFFGTLNMADWVDATSSRVDNGSALMVKAQVNKVPLNVTDYDTFQEVVKKMLFGGSSGLLLGISGLTDVDVTTVLGNIVVRQLPASGNITLDGFPTFGSLPMPVAKDISIGDSTTNSVEVKVNMEVENPTTWGASVPFANIHISYNDTVLGSAIVHDASLSPGRNTVSATLLWEPMEHGGKEAVLIGSELMGQYISGYNTSITLRLHEGSIPSLPQLSKALSGIEVTIPTPRLPGNGDSAPRFIETATMHIISSTADFVLNNPLSHDKLTILKINATAKYNRSELGTIFYDLPFQLRPGADGTTLTPRLPVDWSLGSIAYDALKKALGGELKVHAEAYCTLLIGNLETEVFYNSSKAIPASVRL